MFVYVCVHSLTVYIDFHVCVIFGTTLDYRHEHAHKFLTSRF